MMFWAFTATFYLLLLTIKDFRNGMLVDDRYNWFMMGFTFALLGFFKRSFWFIAAAIVVVVIFNILMRHYKVFGTADINSLTWIMYGFAIVDLVALAWFFGFFAIITLLYHVLKFYLFKNREPQPFYYVLLLCFFLTSILNGLYI